MFPASKSRSRFPARAAILGGLGLFLVAAVACAPARRPGDSVSPPQNPGADDTGGIALRVVYVIRGEGDYLYHDADGNARQADEEALRQALEIAEGAIGAEIFVFHRRPAVTRMFGNVPGGTFSHYRRGKLLRRRQYVAAADPRDLAVEARLYRAYADDYAQPLRILAYFGHEIPLDEADRFTRTLPLWEVPAEGSLKPFDLVILSTCRGGTPSMLRGIGASADYVVASPALLHLSYLDTRALGAFAREAAERPPLAPREETRRLAERVAEESFARLTERTQTEITVAVYDLEAVGPFLRDEGKTAFVGGRGWRDCAADPAFDAQAAARGVTLRYRAPRFGPDRDTAARSAWECFE